MYSASLQVPLPTYQMFGEQNPVLLLGYESDVHGAGVFAEAVHVEYDGFGRINLNLVFAADFFSLGLNFFFQFCVHVVFLFGVLVLVSLFYRWCLILKQPRLFAGHVWFVIGAARNDDADVRWLSSE